MNGLDLTSITALLAALGALLSAATAFFKLLSSPLRRELLVAVITGVFVVSVVVAALAGRPMLKGYQKSAAQERETKIFRNFGPVDVLDNSEYCMQGRTFTDGEIPNDRQMYKVEDSGKTIELNQSPHVAPPPGSSYIIFKSRIDSKECGWCQIFLRKPRDSEGQVTTVNLNAKKYLVFVLQSDSDKDDLLEIKLKDNTLGAPAGKRPLLVKPGWGEYILPLSQFKKQHVNLELVTEISVAHSCPFMITAKENTPDLIEKLNYENIFRLALVSAEQ